MLLRYRGHKDIRCTFRYGNYKKSGPYGSNTLSTTGITQYVTLMYFKSNHDKELVLTRKLSLILFMRIYLHGNTIKNYKVWLIQRKLKRICSIMKYQHPAEP
jgi:hypothetical protein